MPCFIWDEGMGSYALKQQGRRARGRQTCSVLMQAAGFHQNPFWPLSWPYMWKLSSSHIIPFPEPPFKSCAANKKEGAYLCNLLIQWYELAELLLPNHPLLSHGDIPPFPKSRDFSPVTFDLPCANWQLSVEKDVSMYAFKLHWILSQFILNTSQVSLQPLNPL